MNFLCYKFHDSNDTKFIFNDNTSNDKGQQSPANRTLTRLASNEKAVKIECENVCEVRGYKFYVMQRMSVKS